MGSTVVEAGVASALDRIDRAALERADLVVVDTDAHRPPGNHDVVVVPVGAADRWFAPADPPVGAGDEDAPHPVRVVFAGLYTPLQGAPTIGAAIALTAARPDLAFTMIGDGQDRAATQKAVGDDERVRWLDWVDADDLPGVVAAHDVSLGIFATTPKALRVVPNKAFQGQAAGTAVVTGDTAAQRAALGAGALYVPLGDPEALAACLTSLADDRDLLARLQRRAADQAGRHRPAVVVGPLVERLAQLRTDRVAETDRIASAGR